MLLMLSYLAGEGKPGQPHPIYACGFPNAPGTPGGHRAAPWYTWGHLLVASPALFRVWGTEAELHASRR